MLDRCRNREDAVIRQRQVEKREREMREQSRRTAENLRKYDDLVAKNEERRRLEQSRAEMAGVKKW